MQKDLAYRRAGEYAWRAAVGGLIAALLYSWADDDEESGKAITAQGTTDWRDNQVERTIRHPEFQKVVRNNCRMIKYFKQTKHWAQVLRKYQKESSVRALVNFSKTR